MISKTDIALLLLFAACLFSFAGRAQIRYVSSPAQGNGTGENWENASNNLEEMLLQGEEVRVALGTYSLYEELVVPAGKRLIGGWFNGERVENGTENTILEARGEHRVATVAGLLEGVMVTNGLAVRENGGGVWIESTGEVRNCIVRNNRSVRSYPQVGDYLDKDGDLIPQTGLTLSNMPDVRAIVFWVNPDTSAQKGNRGWAVAVPDDVGRPYSGGFLILNSWSESPGSLTAKACATLREALADTAGWANTQSIVANSDYPDPETNAAQACIEYGNPTENIRWYLPAQGQLRHLASEYLAIYVSYERLIENPNDRYYILDAPTYSSTETETNEIWGIDFGGMYVDDHGVTTRLLKTASNRVIPVTSF
ncbi:MAG: hypothetical protein LBR65_06365 [Culturomica sp.]|jgi:hypothetical protein|nr:hypothetical protein [Culturomica sp.]